MAKITLYLNEAQIRSEVSGILTSGMVGVEVKLVCDESWNDLSKTLICRAGDIAKTTFVKDNRAVVAHETVVAGKWLELGVEGRNDDGSVVIPTLWERCCIVLPGADSSADQTVDPTLPIWMQLQKRVESLEVPHAPSDIGALPTPLAAEVGQYLRVAGVNSIGAVTQMEAVDAPKQNDDAVKTVNGIAPDENGNVQIPVSGGNANFLLTVETITVGDSGEPENIPVTGITLDYTTMSLKVGDMMQLAAMVTPNNATNSAVTWETSAGGVATVKDGLVTAIAEGKATITAKSAENTSIKATCVVSVSAAENGGDEPGGDDSGGGTAGEKVQFSTLTMTPGVLKKDGTIVTTFAGTYHVSFPYSEGMEVHALGAAGWSQNTYPPIVVDDGTNAIIHTVEFDGNTITINGKTGQKYSATLTGYAAGSAVYASFVAGSNPTSEDMDDIYYYIVGGEG